jgi:hypothetical protein
MRVTPNMCSKQSYLVLGIILWKKIKKSSICLINSIIFFRELTKAFQGKHVG